MSLSYRNVKNSASKNYVTYDFPNQLPLENVTEGTMAFVKTVTSLYVYNNGWQPIKLENEVPTFDNVPPETVFIPIGSSYNFSLAATDPDGIPITWSYEVVSGSTTVNTLNLSQNNFSFDALDDTLFTVRFKATDTVNEITSDTTFTITNDPPSTPTLLGGATTDVYSHTPQYTTPVQSFTLASIDPEGATPIYSGKINPQSSPSAYYDNNILNWAISGDQLQVVSGFTSDPMYFDITASDGKYSSQTATIQITKGTPPDFNFFPGYDQRIEHDGPNTDVFSQFGNVLDVYRDRIIVGAPNDDDNPDAQFNPQQWGTARIYNIDQVNQTVTLEQKLDSPNRTVYSSFGSAVAIYDDVALVSMPGWSTGIGMVEIFTRSGTTWTQAGAFQGTQNSLFGTDISLCKRSGRLAITAPGINTVYIYNQVGPTSWSLYQTITSPLHPGTNDPLVYAGFGEGVCIDRNQLIIGIRTAYHQPNSSNTFTDSNGAVCYYEIDSSNQFVISEVFYNNGLTEAGEFGHKGKLAIFDDQMIISAPGHDNNNNSPVGRGRVFFYERNSSGVWNNYSTVKTYTSGTYGQREGEAVAIWDNMKLWTSQNTGNTNKPVLHKRTGTSTSSSTTSEAFTRAADTATNWKLKGLAVHWDKLVTGGDHANTSGTGAQGVFYYWQA